MRFPESKYIDQEYGLRIAGTRVSLSSVVVSFRAGQTPQQIVDSFPTVALAPVYGAIAYYLENEQAVNDYYAEAKRRIEKLVRPLSEQAPELYARLQAARRQMGLKRS
jgi:uncharacterized protein (DUF433 family)